MSEHLLRILLTDLAVVRIVCEHCQAVAEVPIKALDRRSLPRPVQPTLCPGCGGTFRKNGGGSHAPPEDAFDKLAVAWEALNAITGLQIEFVVDPPAAK